MELGLRRHCSDWPDAAVVGGCRLYFIPETFHHAAGVFTSAADYPASVQHPVAHECLPVDYRRS